MCDNFVIIYIDKYAARFMMEKNIWNAINTFSKKRSINKAVSYFKVNYIIALKLVTLHQRAKIICLLSREVIDRKVDIELVKKKKNGKILDLRYSTN